jgi:formylmethanofuran dehydrogenase subunit E
MSKLIFWLLVVFAILFALRLVNTAKARKRAKAAEAPKAEAPPPIEETVRCSRCGTYLPKAEARYAPGGLTCGDPDCSRRR